MTARPSLILVLALSMMAQEPAAAQIPGCTGAGLQMESRGERLGSAWSIVISGAPGEIGQLALGAGGTPVATAVGTICVDPANAALVPFVIGPTGSATFQGVLPLDPTAVGATLWLQSGVVDPQSPFGVRLSQAQSRTFRPPMLFIRDFVNGQLVALDAMNRSEVWRISVTPWTGLPAPVPGITYVPALNRLVHWDALGFTVIDPSTGATLASFSETGISSVTGGIEGLNGVVVAKTLAGPPYTTLQVFDFATLSLRPLLPGSSFWNVRGTTLAWLFSAPDATLVDLATNSVVRTVQMNPSLALIEAGGTLFAISPDPSGAWNDIVIAAHDSLAGSVLVPPTQFAAPNSSASFRTAFIGPGTNGEGLWTHWRVGATASNPNGSEILIELNPQTLAVTTTVTIPFSASIWVSPNGSELHLLNLIQGPLPACAPLCNPPMAAPTVAVNVYRIDPAVSTTPSLVGSLPTTFRGLVPIESTSLNRMVVFADQDTVRFLDTSPLSSTTGTQLNLPGVFLGGPLAQNVGQ